MSSVGGKSYVDAATYEDIVRQQELETTLKYLSACTGPYSADKMTLACSVDLTFGRSTLEPLHMVLQARFCPTKGLDSRTDPATYTVPALARTLGYANTPGNALSSSWKDAIAYEYHNPHTRYECTLDERRFPQVIRSQRNFERVAGEIIEKTIRERFQKETSGWRLQESQIPRIRYVPMAQMVKLQMAARTDTWDLATLRPFDELAASRAHVLVSEDAGEGSSTPLGGGYEADDQASSEAQMSTDVLETEVEEIPKEHHRGRRTHLRHLTPKVSRFDSGPASSQQTKKGSRKKRK